MTSCRLLNWTCLWKHDNYHAWAWVSSQHMNALWNVRRGPSSDHYGVLQLLFVRYCWQGRIPSERWRYKDRFWRVTQDFRKRKAGGKFTRGSNTGCSPSPYLRNVLARLRINQEEVTAVWDGCRAWDQPSGFRESGVED